MRTIIHRLTQIGISKNLNTYEVNRIRIFNYCNLFGFLASLVRVVYILFSPVNHYTGTSILLNLLPLTLCVVMALCINYKNYKAATYLSFLCFPPVLLIMYLASHDNSVRFFMILYFIFPFFFLHRPRNIVVAFTIAVFSFILILLASEFHLFIYNKTFYALDAPLEYIDGVFSLVFIFSTLYAIKFMVWSYQRSIKYKRQELKQLNQFKDKMFSVISHDLRSPIAATSQLIDLLKTVPMEQEEFNGYLSELKGQVDNARELMDNMLFWAKRQMENEEIAPDNTGINEIVQETFQALAKQAVNKQIQLISDVDASYIAFADKEMVRVVIRNLLSNAIKFTSEGGYVRIKTSQGNGQQIILEIEDNGVGIPVEKQSMVLGNEYFTSYGTAQEKGSGLGLKICRDFVVKNNGSLSFKSTEGVGTTFTVILPSAKADDERMEVFTVDSLQTKPGSFPAAKYIS